MIDLEAIAEIKKTLAKMKQIEAQLEEARIMVNVLSGSLAERYDIRLRGLIHVTNERYQALEVSIKHLTELAQRMIEQRQSNRLTFNQGWDARLKDLIDQLSAEEYALLRRKLEKIKAGK